MIVMKFGGTSNQDAAAMQNVIRIIRAHHSDRPMIVISAIAGATNQLERAAREAADGNFEMAREVIDTLFARHEDIVGTLLQDANGKSRLRDIIASYRTELHLLLQGVAILRELTPRTMDAVCSFGERISSRFIAAGLAEAGIEAVWIDASEFMITDDTYGAARPIIEEVKTHLQRVAAPVLARGGIPVAPGFIGYTRSGRYTTMGRESSDFSASIIGAAMGAAKVQIWTDVDGILSSDPTMITDVRKVKQMSFDEAFELSYFGAKVLHPHTMLPMIEHGIPVEILSSRAAGGTGTRVGAESPATTGIAKSIAFRRNVTLVAIRPHTRSDQYLFWDNVFNVLNRLHVATSMMATSEHRIACVLEGSVDPTAISDGLGEIGDVEFFTGMASVCIVGQGLRGSAGVVPRIFSALGSEPVHMISFGGSGNNITFVIDDARLPQSMTRLHTELFGSGLNTEVFEAPLR